MNWSQSCTTVMLQGATFSSGAQCEKHMQWRPQRIIDHGNSRPLVLSLMRVMVAPEEFSSSVIILEDFFYHLSMWDKPESTADLWKVSNTDPETNTTELTAFSYRHPAYFKGSSWSLLMLSASLSGSPLHVWSSSRGPGSSSSLKLSSSAPHKHQL